MALFLKNTIFFSFIFILSCIVIFSFADGTTDAFYLKFTTPKQSSLVIGSSRAAQGLIPSVINETSTEYNFFNYAFTIVQSAYGETYLKSIKRKLDPNTKNSNFIVCVNPWVICSETKIEEDSLNFRETSSYLAKTHFVNMKPNFEYLLESYNSKNIDIIKNKYRKGEYQTFFVNDDGWLEVSIESDMVSLKERTRRKLESYKKQFERNNGLSNFRLKKLKETISYLQNHGRVVLLRLPINDDMLHLESQLVPNFDALMFDISKEFNVNYIDAMPDRHKYDYTDGHHLTIESAKRFSKFIADQLIKL